MTFIMTFKYNLLCLILINSAQSQNINIKENSSLESETYKANIHVDWYIVTFLSILYGSISIVSVVGNSLIIWTVMANKRMRNVTNYFISNLAMADIVIGVLVTPFQVNWKASRKFSMGFYFCSIINKKE